MNKAKPIVATIARLPVELHQRIKQLAEQEGRSFNAQLIYLLKDALNRARIKRES
jgi:hypothetical protein